MGKKLRQTNVSGVSRFLPSFDEPSLSPTAGATSTAGPLPTCKLDPFDSESQPASGLPKTGLLGPGNEAHDATGLVPFYTHAAQVPAHLQKYFAQRTRYFSRYDEGCLLDEEGWYSITPEAIATQIAERCRCDVILDAFCGVGGNAIAFARTCERVIALDTSPTRLALARHNAALHGLATRIEFVLADFRDFAARVMHATPVAGRTFERKIDVVFLSPPWGGPEYLADCEYSLSRIQPEPAAELFRLARLLTPNVAFYVPRNTVLEDIATLLTVPMPLGGAENGDRRTVDAEQVEVEEEWMGTKLKALTCYFGGLAQGQEYLF
ncbi:S-adenosyl-L-methionine-dependent methyltransferase [Russula earlei]|uniref:S-adenosyl-L-methionine-dependent methyltransferase n=1 Tax=Russula earlei TaxID=71964 RepID=A0ACC0U080_9AGAM|nr:S-adenosyl-L-methionine-dependent methyltransferase [Russula earlei]